jgi:hypothetical protein
MYAGPPLYPVPHTAARSKTAIGRNKQITFHGISPFPTLLSATRKMQAPAITILAGACVLLWSS